MEKRVECGRDSSNAYTTGVGGEGVCSMYWPRCETCRYCRVRYSTL